MQINGSVTLSWNSTNASSCTALGAWSGNLPLTGSQSQTVGGPSTYTITCSGVGGSASANVTVTAWDTPNVSITADTTGVLANNTVQLAWDADNATACTGVDGLSGPLATLGKQTSPVLTSTTVFSIACSNPVFAAVKASVTITVSTTFTLAVTVSYQSPGAPVIDQAGKYYVPDWAGPVEAPVPYVWVELQDSSGTVVQHTYADANGVASFSGLDPSVSYTPVIRSKINDSVLGLDFVVLNNTAPVDTSQPTYRARYAPYANSGLSYTPGKRLASQSIAVIATDGWDLTQNALIDAQRFAGPYALLAAAVKEAQIVSAASLGSAPTWRPLTILWSTKNKGGLSAPPNQMDNGIVTGSGGYYAASHPGVDSSGNETGSVVSEDSEFISGDQSFEAMELYPFVLTHEMGHFTQSLFSTEESPGGDHSFSDYEDPLVAWIEGSASGIAALVLGTPDENRVVTVDNELVVSIEDPSTNTVDGSSQSWPVGWYQEATITRLMWELYDPQGSVKLSAPQVLAPLYSSNWKAGPWLDTAWAYTAQLASLNPAEASAIDGLADAVNITASGDDEWGTTETHTGNLEAQDAIPPYTTVVIGGAPVTVCSTGAPNDFNKESSVRYFRIMGDGSSHTLKIQGPSGTVPLLSRNLLVAGSNVLSISGTFSSGYNVFSVGDCSVAASEFSSETSVCKEPSTPPVEQCWTISVQ